MDEIIFIVKESEEGGYEANALNYPIFTDGESIDEVKFNTKEAVQCHFDDDMKRIVRLHFVHEEVFAV